MSLWCQDVTLNLSAWTALFSACKWLYFLKSVQNKIKHPHYSCSPLTSTHSSIHSSIHSISVFLFLSLPDILWHFYSDVKVVPQGLWPEACREHSSWSSPPRSASSSLSFNCWIERSEIFGTNSLHRVLSHSLSLYQHQGSAHQPQQAAPSSTILSFTSTFYCSAVLYTFTAITDWFLFTVRSWLKTLIAQRWGKKREKEREAVCMKAAGLIGESGPEESTLGRASWTLGK